MDCRRSREGRAACRRVLFVYGRGSCKRTYETALPALKRKRAAHRHQLDSSHPVDAATIGIPMATKPTMCTNRRIAVDSKSPKLPNPNAYATPSCNARGHVSPSETASEQAPQR